MNVTPWQTIILVGTIATALGVLGLGNSTVDYAVAGEASSGLPKSRIVFSRGSDLYVAASDGSAARRLARSASQPAVSPDRRRIAFVRARAIWVMNRDGSAQRRLTSGHENITPAWSPDGATIYFSRYIVKRDKRGDFEGYAWAIFSMRTDGSGVRQLTRPQPSDHGTCHESPAPSPDGRIIAFADFGDCDHGFDASVSAVDAAGRTVSLERFDLGSGFDPAWSPDGRMLAFASTNDFDENTGIEVARSGGSRARRVYRGRASGPAWSPNGEWIAFEAGTENGDIRLVRRDGTGRRLLMRTTAKESGPAWLAPVR